MAESMKDFLAAHSGLRYSFFGGKGGVGKTVMAGAMALHLAQQGRRTLLASTNPVHSLSSLLDQNVFGAETPVNGVPNLWAYEIDTTDTIERSKKEIGEKIRWFLKFADIPTQADAFVETATMNPAFEESAMFENMINLMFENKYDAYVFDTAPTANARRLLGMSKVYSLWVNKMLESRKEAQVMRLSLSFRKKEEKDPLLDYLLSFQERMGHARDLLTDGEKTAFFFVTLPEALPIAVVRRFIGWFKDFGIPVGGVIVNGVIRLEGGRDGQANRANKTGQADEAGQVAATESPTSQASGQGAVADFVLNRVEMQKGYLEQIHSTFSDVRAIVPLFETEVRGTAALGRVVGDLFV